MSDFLIRSQRSVGEWLRLSVCWTSACVLLFITFNVLLHWLLPLLSGRASSTAYFLSGSVAHCLIWSQAVVGGNAIIEREERLHAFTWTRLAANAWLVGLTVFQLFCLFGLLLLGVAWR